MGEDLQGRRALVTGAAAGIGLAVAHRLTAAGARVAMTDLDEDAVTAAADDVGGGAIALRCDVRSTAEVEDATRRAVADLGGLDILVNNAGIEMAVPLAEMSEEDLQQVQDVNVVGAFRQTKAALGALSDGGGAIVNVASVAGLGAAPLLGAYCASKAALLRLTETYAVELRDAGIRVNAVCPAFIGTSMVERLMGPYEGLARSMAGVGVEELIGMAQGRLGTVEEVADAVVFLAGDESSFTTGSHLVVDNVLTGSLL